MYLRRVIGQVKEETHILHRTILLEVLFEETSCLHVYTHGSEYNGEIVVMIVHDALTRQLYQAGLPADLSSNLDRKR